MARIPGLKILSAQAIDAIHNASLAILRDTGVMVHHGETLERLEASGATVDRANRIARLPEQLVLDRVAQAGNKYVLYGRDAKQTVRFGYGDLILMSSPGQYSWIDGQSPYRRPATIQDARDAIRLGEALDNIQIVGAMAQPAEISEKYRDVFLTAELVKGATKPTRCWIRNGRSARYVLEIYRTIAGGEAALRKQPMAEAFLEPISPLQYPKDGLDIVWEFAQAGQPVSIGPMAMASGTAPATLAGTLALENAEILAGIVMTQLLAPGTPVTYGGIPHIMDPRTSICSFGSPEQGLMAVAMIQMARSYGLPVYVNVGLTDAKVPDAQAGIEKATSLLLGVLAGADTFGHCGICGTDHAGSLLWLFLDHEIMNYVKRINRGFDVDRETLAVDVIQRIGPGGNFLSDPHTVDHYRNELWLTGRSWTRKSWDEWSAQGGDSLADRMSMQVKKILDSPPVQPLEEALSNEIDSIVECARNELDETS